MIIVERIHTDPARTLLLGTAYRQLHQARIESAWGGQGEREWPPVSALPTWPTDQKGLLEEYHMLVDLDRRVELTPAQRDRLQAVEEELDDLDEATPGAQWMTSRIVQTSDKLDALLEAVRDLAGRRTP